MPMFLSTVALLAFGFLSCQSASTSEPKTTPKNGGSEHDGLGSPIHIKSSEATHKTGYTLKVFWPNYAPCRYENRGHGNTIQEILTDPEQISELEMPGLLQNKHQFNHVSFFWAKDNSHSGGHPINDKIYPMEVHLLYYNTKYPDYETAKLKEDGLVIISIPHCVTEDAPKESKELAGYVKQIIEPNTSVDANTMTTLTSYLEKKHDYYVYNGSWTIPPYVDGAMWIVFAEPFKIKPKDMAVFRTVKDPSGQEIKENCRPVQPTAGRSVLHFTKDS